MAPTTQEAVYAEMELFLGQVPTFIKAIPASALVGAWWEFRNIYLNPNTRLSSKSKNLIAVGVAAQAGNPVALEFHQGIALLAGATAQELGEAVAVASCVGHWSSYLNGSQANETVFRKEVEAIFRHLEHE